MLLLGTAPLTEQDLQISCIRFFKQIYTALKADSVSLTTCSSVLCPSDISPPRYSCLSTPPSTGITRSRRYYGLIRTTYAPSPDFVSSVLSSLLMGSLLTA